MSLARSGAMGSSEVVSGNIEFYTLFTTIDITRTGDFSDNTQKDFESVVQVIGLRAQPVVMNNPVALNGSGANVLENYGAPTLTGAGHIFKFAFCVGSLCFPGIVLFFYWYRAEPSRFVPLPSLPLFFLTDLNFLSL